VAARLADLGTHTRSEAVAHAVHWALAAPAAPRRGRSRAAGPQPLVALVFPSADTLELGSRSVIPYAPLAIPATADALGTWALVPAAVVQERDADEPPDAAAAAGDALALRIIALPAAPIAFVDPPEWLIE
jgi:hypothetical protein